MIVRSCILLLLACSSLLTACGGGEPAPTPLALSAHKFAAAQRADVQASSVTPAQAAEQLLNAAETAYPDYFPGHPETLTYGPFMYRAYATGVYVGVVVVANMGYPQSWVYLAGAGYGDADHPTPQAHVNYFLPGLVIEEQGGATKYQ